MPRATTDHHPATRRGPRRPPRTPARWPAGRMIPHDRDEVLVALGDRRVKLTNLRKLFWPALGITKGDLAPVLLPHLRDRAMVMRRYPDGAGGKSFFMKRAPTPRPEWLATCAIEHASGNVIDFPMIQDLAALLCVVNLGCIDLNQWYARCDDVDRPDYLHFDLDPTEGATFAQVLETARILHTTLDHLGMPSYPKTTGSRGIHVYVPIVRGPTQKEVWTAARTISVALARHHPALITAEYSMARRPRARVLVDYNQNAWRRTLASVYSVRPTPRAAASTPVTWPEVERGIAIDDFRIDNVPARVRQRGDLWAPLLAKRGRVDLARFG